MSESNITRRSLFKWLAAAAAAAVLPWLPKPAQRQKMPWEVKYWIVPDDPGEPDFKYGGMGDLYHELRGQLSGYRVHPILFGQGTPREKTVWLINPLKSLS